MQTETNYLQDISLQFRYYKKLGEWTFQQLSDEDFIWKVNDDHNSIAVIIKHLRGNMLSRWTDFPNSDGEKSWRDRDSEFVEDITDVQELIRIWNEGWAVTMHAIESLNPGQLNDTAYIRNMGQPIIQLINRQLAHYAYHVGQIVMIAKMRLGKKWKSLTIPKGKSNEYNAQKFDQKKRKAHFTKREN